MAKILELNDAEWSKWLDGRPEIVRRRATEFPPDRLYRLTNTNQVVTLLSYAENDTCRVQVHGFVNGYLPFCERQVFGVAYADLEEIDVPEWMQGAGSGAGIRAGKEQG